MRLWQASQWSMQGNGSTESKYSEIAWLCNRDAYVKEKSLRKNRHWKRPEACMHDWVWIKAVSACNCLLVCLWRHHFPSVSKWGWTIGVRDSWEQEFHLFCFLVFWFVMFSMILSGSIKLGSIGGGKHSDANIAPADGFATVSSMGKKWSVEYNRHG